MTVVDAGSQTIAGPANRSPGRKLRRDRRRCVSQRLPVEVGPCVVLPARSLGACATCSRRGSGGDELPAGFDPRGDNFQRRGPSCT